jgi:hypothetical protein
MAKKTVFEGLINGVMFDNVKDYNKALTKLINDGVAIEASTKTSTIDEKCCDCDNCTCEDCNCEDSENISMLPGFDHGCDDCGNWGYIDDYVTTDIEKDNASIAQLKCRLGDNLEEILKRINSMDEASLENYKADVEKIIDIIDEDKRNTIQAIEKAVKEIEINNKRKEVLDRAMGVIKIWEDNYNSIKLAIEDESSNYQSSEKTDNKIVDDFVKMAANEDEIVEALSNRLYLALNNLLKSARTIKIDNKNIENMF